MPIYSVNLPSEVYRDGERQRDWNSRITVKKIRIDAASREQALSRALIEVRGNNGKVFYNILSTEIGRYVKEAPPQTSPTHVRHGTGYSPVDPVQISQEARAAYESKQNSVCPVRLVGQDELISTYPNPSLRSSQEPMCGVTVSISQVGLFGQPMKIEDYRFPSKTTSHKGIEVTEGARRAAAILSDGEDLSPEQLERNARNLQAISDYTQRKRAQGIFTPEQEQSDKEDRIRAARERARHKTVEPVKKTEPKPAQGTLFDNTPRSYLGERLDMSG